MRAERFRRQLGAELRGLRTRVGLSQNDIGTGEAALTQVTVSRYERGTRLPVLDEILLWLDVTRASDEVRERVMALFEAAHVPEGPLADRVAEEYLSSAQKARVIELAEEIVRTAQDDQLADDEPEED